MLVEDGVEANGDPPPSSMLLVLVPGPTAAGMLPDLGMVSMVA